MTLDTKQMPGYYPIEYPVGKGTRVDGKLMPFYARAVGGEGATAADGLEAAMVHEMLGHVYDGITQSEATDETKAMAIENLYHANQPHDLQRFAKTCNGVMPYMGTP